MVLWGEVITSQHHGKNALMDLAGQISSLNVLMFLAGIYSKSQHDEMRREAGTGHDSCEVKTKIVIPVSILLIRCLICSAINSTLQNRWSLVNPTHTPPEAKCSLANIKVWMLQKVILEWWPNTRQDPCKKGTIF